MRRVKPMVTWGVTKLVLLMTPDFDHINALIFCRIQDEDATNLTSSPASILLQLQNLNYLQIQVQPALESLWQILSFSGFDC